MAESKIDLNMVKRSVNIADLAMNRYGYEIDPSQSTKSYDVVRRGDDKIAVSQARDTGFYIYYNFKDDRDKGTVIDFIVRRENVPVKDAIRLAGDLGGVERPQGKEFKPRYEQIQKDRTAVVDKIRSMEKVERSEYLESRGLSIATIGAKRFEGRILGDERNNVVFPHFDEKGPSGGEVKNNGFTGFMTGGSRGLWVSLGKKNDNKLVVTEGAVDALSYYQAKDDGKTRYVSTGGTLTDKQVDLLGKMLDQMGKGAVIVDATDRDAAGEGYSAKLVAKFGDRVVEDKTAVGKDWNDKIKSDVLQKNLGNERKEETGLKVAKGVADARLGFEQEATTRKIAEVEKIEREQTKAIDSVKRPVMEVERER